MAETHLFALGVISILALGALLIGGNASMTGAFWAGDFELFDVGYGTQMYVQYPVPVLSPQQEYLTPTYATLEVNNIPIPSYLPYSFISLDKDEIVSYSGSAGPYVPDAAPHLQGLLCSFAYKVKGAPMYCERVELEYSGGELSFARGYAPSEYVANQAAGTYFAVVFLLKDKLDNIILGQSPIAYLRWTRD